MILFRIVFIIGLAILAGKYLIFPVIKSLIPKYKIKEIQLEGKKQHLEDIKKTIVLEKEIEKVDKEIWDAQLEGAYGEKEKTTG